MCNTLDSVYILFYYEGQNEETFLSPNRDDCTQPYIDLRNALEARRVVLEMTPKRALEEYRYLCFWNVFSLEPLFFIPRFKRRLKLLFQFRRFQTVFAEALRTRLQDRMILFLSEPPSVRPENYDSETHNHFNKVFTWNHSLLARGGKYVRFNIPTAKMSFPNVSASFRQRKLLVDISANKFSPHDRELYSERRRTIQYFEKRFPDQFDLYGFGWGESKSYDRHNYKNYRGVVESKQKVFPSYRFAICYENIRDEPNYISNRLFDVLQSDCVPIYWGAPNVSDYVDPETMVNRCAFSSNEELGEYISSVTEEEHQKYRDAIRRYVMGDRIKAFFSSVFIEKFCQTLGL